MADLDPATLEKFQKFQAMLAESPEIVEALNSPEILALAAKAAEKKNSSLLDAELEVEVEPEPDYPTVGYGVSDDVSVLSEMTTPTVMTRQSVEEDEYYPEVDGAGVSSSGLGGGPRRIGLKIGVSAFEDGALPPPPPKPKSKINHKMRHRTMTRKIKPSMPMSRIVENDGSVSTESTEPLKKSPGRLKKSYWKPKSGSEISEENPFLGATGSPGSISRSARQLTARSKNRGGMNGRGVNRNRSMPASIKLNNIDAANSDSVCDDDDNTKASSGSNLAPSTEGKLSPKLVHSKSSSSLGKGKTRSATNGRGVNRNRSMPLKAKRSHSSDSASSENLFEDDENTKASTNSIFSLASFSGKVAPKAALSPPRTSDGRGMIQSTGARKARGSSAPRMRLVPVVNKSIVSNASSSVKTARSNRTDSRSRSRSRSVEKDEALDVNDDDNNNSSPQKSSTRYSQPPDPTNAGEVCLSDDDGDNAENESSHSKTELSVSSSSHDSKGRSYKGRRWTPPAIELSELPPAFRLSMSNHSRLSVSNHSQRSREGTTDISKPASQTKRSNKPSSFRGYSNHSKSEERKESKPEDPKENRPEEQHECKPVEQQETKQKDENESKSEEEKESRPEEQERKNPEEQMECKPEKQKEAITSSDDDDDNEDYVRQTVRKPAKVKPPAPFRPNAEEFKRNLAELTQVIQGDTSRPSDYLGGSPFTATRKKRGQSAKKTYGNPPPESCTARSQDWLGSGKTGKRTWKVKERNNKSDGDLQLLVGHK